MANIPKCDKKKKHEVYMRKVQGTPRKVKTVKTSRKQGKSISLPHISDAQNHYQNPWEPVGIHLKCKKDKYLSSMNSISGIT